MSDEQTPDSSEHADDVELDTSAEASTDNNDSDATDAQALQAQIDELKEGQLRLAAEAQNIRRRAEADVEKARKFGSESLIKELLPVADSFERALEAARVLEGFDPAMLEGMEATQKLFIEALVKNGLARIEPKGEPFNPDQHQAISMVPSELPANHVVDVVQTGYSLHSRTLRAAMVVVSQGAPKGVDETA